MVTSSVPQSPGSSPPLSCLQTNSTLAILSLRRCRPCVELAGTSLPTPSMYLIQNDIELTGFKARRLAHRVQHHHALLDSFYMEYHWARHTTTQPEVSLTHTILSSSHPPYKGQPKHVLQRPPPSSQRYIFPTYLSYILFPPLYIAGPITSFNDFLSQVRPPVLP